MNKMIRRAAKALQEATANAPFYVYPSPYKLKYNVLEMLPPNFVDKYHGNLLSQDEAEDLCEQLNNEWIVKKVLEALKCEEYEDFSLNISDKFADLHNRMWGESNSKHVWNTWLDAILSAKDEA